MRIAICDDEKCYIEAVEASIERWKKTRGVFTISVVSYTSSEDFAYLVEKSNHFDIVFLDIQFPKELNGIVLAENLRKGNEFISIVFITNYDEYAIEGYKVNALRFLQKPLQDSQIFECLDIAYGQCQLMNNDSLIIEGKRSMFRIPYIKIIYCESKAHYIILHLIDGQEEQIRSKLTDIYKQLPKDGFIQTHRSYIVNLFHVYSFTKDTVTMLDGSILPLQKKQWSELYFKFRKLFQGK